MELCGQLQHGSKGSRSIPPPHGVGGPPIRTTTMDPDQKPCTHTLWMMQRGSKRGPFLVANFVPFGVLEGSEPRPPPCPEGPGRPRSCYTEGMSPKDAGVCFHPKPLPPAPCGIPKRSRKHGRNGGADPARIFVVSNTWPSAGMTLLTPNNPQKRSISMFWTPVRLFPARSEGPRPSKNSPRSVA